ncbi:MAG: hypothetical protein K2L86_11100 [Lachnospiraceae bacterium]|nr:hypothetical protein [Lachnospiraceae bacterium]
MAIQYTPIDLINKISNNNYSYTTHRVKKVTETDTSVEKLQDKSESFRKKLQKLKRYTSGGISKDMLETQLTDFLKSYNDMNESAESVTNKDIQKQITKLEKLFTDNEKDLKKIGVEKVNGRYTLNSKTFEKAKDKNIDTLLIGHDSFINKADKIMRNLDDTAGNAVYSTVTHNTSTTTKYEDLDLAYASYATLASSSILTLEKCNAFVQSGNVSDAIVQESIHDSLNFLASSTNIILRISPEKSGSVKQYYELCLENKDKLAKVGLNFDSDNKQMTLDSTVDMTTSDYKSAFNELFGANAAFGTELSAYCKNMVNDILKTSKIGVSIIDEQI